MVSSDTGTRRDPGWRAALTWQTLLLPFPRIITKADGLTAARGMFVSWTLAEVWIVVVVRLVLGDTSGDGSVDPQVAAAGVCLFGVLSLVLVRWAATKPLDAGSEESLATSFHAAFLLQLALSQAAFLMGFVAAFVAQRWWLILVGIPFMAVGFAAAAPTSGKLRRLQERLRRDGSTLDLVTVLLSQRPQVGKRA